MQPLDLAGRRALVTGGNRGIGLAVTRALAGAGAAVTFTARNAANREAALAEFDGLPVEGQVCDVTDRAGMSALLARGFDILINNAGIIGPIGPMLEVDARDWARNIETNLVGAFHATQCALRGMLAMGGGTIVNLSSGAAHRPMEGWSAYCAGKAGLAMLTRATHLEYGHRGIRVFGFAPGIVDTDMQVMIRASGINPVSQLKREQLTQAAEPAFAIAWLCTAAADALAGQELDVRHMEFRRACGLPEPA